MPPPSRQELEAARGRWLASLRADKRSSTADTYAKPVGEFLEATEGKLTRQAIDVYIGKLQSRAPATRNKNISAARSFLQYVMLVEELIPYCPIDALLHHTKLRIESNPAARTLENMELEALLYAARRLGDVPTAVVWLLATCGMRVSELAAANWNDVIRDRRTGRMKLYIRTLKGGRNHHVELVPALFTLLAKLHGSQRLSNTDTSPLIARENGQRFSRFDINRLLQRVTREAFGKRYRKHRPVSGSWFRHTVATLLAEQNANAFQIQQQLGHRDLSTSQHYVALAHGLETSPTHLLPAFLTGAGYTQPSRSGTFGVGGAGW